MSEQIEPVSLLKGLEKVETRITRERLMRLINAKEILSFGVPFLDEALGGIFSNDLILLGAKTGFGKSQLAMLIASENVKRGKRVHFLALEAEEYEIERRMKYQFIAQKFFSSPNRPKIHLNYMDWYYGRFDEALDAYEREAEEEIAKASGLTTYYRRGDFTVDEFERIALGVKNETDLIIIDHLHYFDFEDSNENRAIKDTVKKIRDCALLSGKPIILIAHVRKSDKRIQQLIPDLEDFHGSSDIGKIATKAITIALCYAEGNDNQRKTYFQILKCRVDGSRTTMTGLVPFNLAHQRYERQYSLGKLSRDGTTFSSFKFNELPPWAINAIV